MENEEVTLLNCDKEPIHIPGKIQAHGFVIICSGEDLIINQISKNIYDFLEIKPEDLLNTPLENLLEKQTIEDIKKHLVAGNFLLFNPYNLVITVNNINKYFNIICSLNDNLLILEFEPFQENELNNYSMFYYAFNTALTKIQSTVSLKDLFQTTAEQIKILTDYDRVMVYRFDKDWNGEVVGEAKNQDLESYKGLHYPHTDIPAQARELYLKNWIRIIVDVNTPQVPLMPVINPKTNKPVDLSNTVLRATSPIHIEYLQNMGVNATLTISIIYEGKLWGLFACHNYSPKFINYHLRNTCELIGKIFSNHLSYKQEDEDLKYRELIKTTTATIIENISKDWDIVYSLIKGNPNILDMNESSSAILYYDEKFYILGDLINEKDLNVIINYLKKSNENIIVTNELSKLIPKLISIKEKASGLMSVKISEDDYIIWLKPEVLQTVDWGGKPDKNIVVENDIARLSPRKSFEKWSEQKENQSSDWKSAEIDSAMQLRENIINIVLKNMLTVKKLNRDLELQKQSLTDKNNELSNFAHVASHDLKEPLRIITNYNQLLLRRYKDKLDSDAMEFIQYSIDGGNRMKLLIDSLLQYAKIGTSSFNFEEININDVIDTVINNLKIQIDEKNVLINKSNLPVIVADKVLIELIFRNLINNAIKYSSQAPIIDISYKEDKNEYIFIIKDNGIGIDSKYHESIFSMFKRLHGRSEYEGTGIGLATVKKIVEAHNGKIWIESEEKKGSVFYFTISKNLNKSE